MPRVLSLPGPANFDAGASILIRAVRGWRQARDSGDAVQPRLFAELSRGRHGMLAPVFDSLIGLYEKVLGRAIAVSRVATPSDDERLLLELMQGVRSRAGCLSCEEGLGSTFDCAICSARIMMAMTLDPAAETG